MDVLDYDSLLHKTKTSLCNNVQIKMVSFPNHFNSLLTDCRLCITQVSFYYIYQQSHKSSSFYKVRAEIVQSQPKDTHFYYFILFQSLDFVVNILSGANILQSKLSQYIENAVSLLQMLSDLIKNVVESISMSCCSFNTFPTTTGQIIMLVFSHCKNR